MKSERKSDHFISVLIPCYNHEAYIGETVRSVLAQEDVNLEILIADDCSSDRSIDIIREIDDSRLRIFPFSENHGTAWALNFLMEKSRGEYLAFLGSDDLFVQGKLKKQVDIFEQMPNVGAVFTWAEIIDQHGKLCMDSDAINLSVFQKDNASGAQWLRCFFEEGNRLCHSSAMIRKAVYEQVGNYQLFFRQLHDFDYWVRILCHWEIYVIPEKLTKYRRATEKNRSVSAKSDENRIRLMNEYAMIFAGLFKEMPEQLFANGFGDLLEQRTKVSLEYAKYEVLKKLKMAGCALPMASFIYFCSVYERNGRNSLFEDCGGKLEQSLYRDTACRAVDYGLGMKKELLAYTKKKIRSKCGKEKHD